jgi:hypothetical protein
MRPQHVDKDNRDKQGGQGPGRGRGANAGEAHLDEVPGEEGTGPGLSTGLHGRKGKGMDAEERSKEADAGVADEQEGQPELGAEEKKHLHGDAGIARR